MPPTISLDISKYDIEELLSILNIIDPNVFKVTDMANSLIAKMTTDNRPEMVTFITQARDKVLDYLRKRDREDPVDNETTEKIDRVWASKIFKDNSDDQTEYFDDGSHITSKQRAQLTATVEEPIISSHVVVIDSQFRSTILPYSNNTSANSFNTSFTFNLSSPITKAISMKLYSYHLPTTWKAFSIQFGNTFFIYNGILIVIPDGNYTPESIITTLTLLFAKNIATAKLEVYYDTTKGLFSFINTDPLIGTATMTFFIKANTINFTNCGVSSLTEFQTLSVNTTLGWLLGFHTTPDPVTGDVNLSLPPNVPVVADVPPDIYGPKYFTLNVEDYSNQRLAGALYGITNSKQYSSLTVQEYYHTIDVACKYREGSLTQAQLFAINAISNPNTTTNVSANYTNGLTGYTSNSTFAIIPLENITRPNPYIKFGADLFIHKRNYVKPSILERFNVSLHDDKGNLVNLYDNDWSFSLIVEERLN